MAAVVRAIETGQTRGFMRAVIDARTRQILGGLRARCDVHASPAGGRTQRPVRDRRFRRRVALHDSGAVPAVPGDRGRLRSLGRRRHR
ncbi:hypothetical protein [Streptomyces gramineus]|uniref:hypothetical protein n=1 Tax=Streptomyces gramineus TaxID=910542 RepID=UPI00398AF51A